MLKQKSVILVHIANFGRDEVEVSEYNKKEVEMEWLDLSLFLKSRLTGIDEQLVLLHKNENKK